ncbi:MAG TPA: HAMP domain-containing sensor histidine kinase [Nocardia sp.]|uniref:HAMP domain-containing sensor histidine kinase n=1 Tax=Nocardia sp. TaxID=1821 RepID=UPI002B4AD108|nr:HAMP domain-containing sensor histidine kinase [Nocardia sp.]HLS76976.1 HAMP domain-containing sensor histidine kinase [Nocardia sp.]
MKTALRPHDPRGEDEHAPSAASFGTRLFIALTAVVVGCAVIAWIVASTVAPGIFNDHLGMAGIEHGSSQAAHVEQAFAQSIRLAWGLAVALAVLLALAVSWYITHRVQRSLVAVTSSTACIAGGHYDSRVPSPGLGREFDELATTVNELARRLEATETTRRRMLADLGHEMRTPIATLDSYLEALDDNVRGYDDDTRHVLRAATHRLERLVQDIDAVSRAEEHLTDLHPVPTTTATLVTHAVHTAGEQFDAKGVALRTAIHDSATVTVDPDRLAQVLANLLHNALRHTPTGGEVTVSSWLTGRDRAELAVTDTGDGIAPEHLDHLFDRFYRADPARTRHPGGSGIGLTISRALVEAHHGRIRAHSAGPGHGSRFTVELPVTP